MQLWRSLRVAVFLAIRSVARGNYGIAALTTLMMSLIYVNLLFLPSLIEGAIAKINDQVVETTTGDIVITPAGGAARIDDADAYLERVRRTPGVASATATHRVGTEVSHGSESGVWTVEAIDPESYADVFTTPANLLEGRYLGGEAADEIFLGIDVAGADRPGLRGYGGSLKSVHAGDRVDVTLTTGQVRPFTVAGVYLNRFAFSDDRAFIPWRTAVALDPRIADHATAINVRTGDGADAQEVAARLRDLRAGVEVRTSDIVGAAVKDQVDTFDLVNDILRFASLIVAAITVLIVTYVDLVNKRRQIGIERAIGIRSGAIVASYVLKAWAYAIVGVGVGLLVFVYAISPLVDRHPFQFPNGPVVLVTGGEEMRRNVLVLLLVTMVGALAPAIRSVRIRILDAIWGD